MKRVVLVALLFATACAASAGTPRRTSYDRSALARDELATRSTDNMHVVVSALRPNWLVTPMGGAGIGNTAASAPVQIIVDGQLFGGAEHLKSISATSVERARYYSTTEAQSKFGFRVESPIIEIVSRRPGS